MSNLGDPLTVFWAPAKGLGLLSGSALCLLGSCWLHCTTAAVLDGRPKAWASPRRWDLLLQLGCTFTRSLSWALCLLPSLSFSEWPLSPEPSTAIDPAPSSTTSAGLSQCLALAALNETFTPYKPAPSGRLLHHQVCLASGVYSLYQRDIELVLTVGKDGCCQAWKLLFNSQSPHVGKRKAAPTNCQWPSQVYHDMLPTYTHVNK